MTRNSGEPIARLRRSLGLRATRHPPPSDRFSPLLNLAIFSEVLGKPQPDWPANTVHRLCVRPPQWRRPESTAAAVFGSGAPPITFTLGSTAVMDPGRFFEASAVAARQLGRRALLLMG